MDNLIVVFVILVGLIMVIVPNLFYEITEGWKSDWSNEPSNFYIICIRFGGVMCLISGVCYFIFR